MTDSSGNQVESTDYMPFGGIRNHTGTNTSNYKFTDQELDAENGLYNYNARLYDPIIGRFISADPIIPDPYNPQSLNRYSYCLNNPLIYVDPSGYQEKKDDYPWYYVLEEIVVIGVRTAPYGVGTALMEYLERQRWIQEQIQEQTLYLIQWINKNILGHTENVPPGGAPWGSGGGSGGNPGKPNDQSKGGGSGGESTDNSNKQSDEPAPKQTPTWNTVKATREGLIGHKTANGHVIKEDDIFVALPSRKALNKNVELEYNGKIITAPVWDVGPWNTNDPYWITPTRPQAESGKDLFGRITNGAGIDLSNDAFYNLGLKDNSYINWRFIDE